MNWEKIFRSELLAKVGKSCSTTRELAEALSEKLGVEITVDALFNAHKRHRKRYNLKSSLLDYMGRSNKPPKIKPEDIRFSLSIAKRKEVRNASRFIITSAMNNCSVDDQFWGAVKQYAEHRSACILVVPTRYKNPTSPPEAQRRADDAWWDENVLHHMTDDLIELHEHLWLMAHIRVRATATNPLNGLETLSRGASAVLGHPQQALKMVPTPQNKLPKLLYSTGSCTQAVYSDSRTGICGDFHHTIGALVVERDGPRFHVRNLSADDSGGFYDLNYYYCGSKAPELATAIPAIVTGDEHAIFADPACKAATYLNDDSIVKTLKPEKIVRHDVFDAYTISHHNRKDPIIQYGNHKYGIYKVQDELDVTISYIQETTPDSAENIIVSSNHHDHLTRWLKEVHVPVTEPWNVDVWLELWNFVKDTVDFRESGVVCDDLFARYAAKRLTVPTKFLPTDSEEEIAGVLVGFHGHNGANGSRGSIVQFSKIGAKTITGHGHSPGIHHGAYRVGTSSMLKLGYNAGPSSWAHCHAVIYPNGKRQLIFIVNGHWRLSEKASDSEKLENN